MSPSPSPTLPQELFDTHPLHDEQLVLDLPACCISISSTSADLLQTLRHYFRHLVCTPEQVGPHVLTVQAVEATSPDWNLPWVDWAREPGKTGQKDAFIDYPNGRLLKKVRTGMVFWQSFECAVAYGPCLANANQVINFILNQYMSFLQRERWLIGHAAAACLPGGPCLAFAGLSGGGKSTAMLHLMQEPDWQFISNDRLFFKVVDDALTVRGIPKLPRINPGTILADPLLRPMLSVEELDTFTALPADELWQLEHKFDVDVLATYGPNRLTNEATIDALVILDWQRESEQETTFQRTSFSEEPTLVEAIMKSSGPFYQDADEQFLPNFLTPQPKPYWLMLADLPLIAVRGRVDFLALKQYCLGELQ